MGGNIDELQSVSRVEYTLLKYKSIYIGGIGRYKEMVETD